MGTERREDQGRGEQEPERERHRDSFLCLPHCLPARSLPLSSYLAVHPLTSSQRPLSFFISFVALPPPHSPFTSFCLAGIYLEMITPPSSLHLPLYSPLGLPFHLQARLALFPSISPPSPSLSPLLSKWLLWKHVYLEMAGGKLFLRFVSSILILPCE